MTETFYKGYWMITNRCNLDCGYCVLEDAPEQLGRELDLDGKRSLISHLYEALGFRRLTLSGGEVTIIGRQAPREFVELLRYLKRYRSSRPRENLEVELYTNGTLLDDTVADEMKGVVDLVAVTIDSARDGTLTRIGRNTGRYRRYLEAAVAVCARVHRRGIGLKLHTVVGKLNCAVVADEVATILDEVESTGARVSTWKFYQYMSYEDAERDGAHAITSEAFSQVADQIARALQGRDVALHFKDNVEMSSSLFNILSYGNAQYLGHGDTWASSRRTADLRTYVSMEHLLKSNEIDQATFRRFHEIRR